MMKKHAKPGIAAAASSIILFGLFHFSFLMLGLGYQGGATNLVGGALIMGAHWYLVAAKSGTIRYGIFAHQIVNSLAFASLFVLNRV